ncbi:MAG TPA: Gfo/Idh/MocA family oxidoreductase [Prolixibacteraceae bacterium]|nr:Gfo/Idh/MocA family oxidoreductase [Prolixibacteraceae bacterium]
MTEHKSTTSRRDFLKSSIVGISALSILPSTVIAGLGHPAPSDKLNIAVIGVGGVGFRNLSNLLQENIVALCDVDWNYGQKALRRWSMAKRYTDFRIMLEKENEIDAVVIATPDHSHSVAAMAAMQLQKHVYVQAPMAHAVFEARRMTETARVYGVVSQVGNQSASGNENRDIAEIIWSGAIGEINEVHAWTDEPKWKQGDFYPTDEMRVPKDLDWELFIGPASKIPYHSTYTPFGWRAWWNFGNGALASMGPHLLETVFRALKLNAPVKVEASSTSVNLQSAPKAQKIIFGFSKRNNLPNLAMPPVNLYWYDGGLKPELPDNIELNSLKNYAEGGVIFRGSKGVLICGPEGRDYTVVINGLPVNMNVEKQLHRIENPYDGGHEHDWVRACKESANNRLMPSACFDTQIALSETLLVGAMAVRMQSLGKKLEWDSAQTRFVNINNYEEFEISHTGDLYIQNGIPKFDSEKTKYNASHFVDQTVRPLYRSGWNQI